MVLKIAKPSSSNLVFARTPFKALTATGGNSIYDIAVGGVRYRVHEFRTTGTSTFTVSSLGSGLHPKIAGASANTIEYLIVAGGGGGGSNGGGGGGAGGLLHNINGSPISITAQSYTIVVGAGGQARFGGEPATQLATNGQDSSAFGLTAKGGGYGGAGGGSASTQGNGNGGGSGGGAAAYNNISRSGGSAESGQGNRGGNAATTAVVVVAAGGGGAGAAGADLSSNVNASSDGGIGLLLDITGTSIYYAGGGGGYGLVNSQGGLGGGGNGRPNGVSGTANTGGGGAGGLANGGAGGSGIVIVRYPI